MRTIIYARYSSALQDKRSIEDQVRVCRDRCDREGWTVVDVFSDYEISGKVYARPGLQAALERVAAGGIDQVIAEALDRVARSQVDTPLIHQKIRFAGARLFTLSQGEVTELHTAFQGAMDALQLKELAAKVRRGQRGMASKGRITGGRAYGYKVANRILDDGVTVEKGLTAIDEEEAGIVRRIYREFLAGKSPVMIARQLNREKVPGPSGGLWRVSSINGDRIRKNGILQNELYDGRLVYNKTHRDYDPETRRRVIRSNPPGEWQVTEVEALRIVPHVDWLAVEQHRERYDGVPCRQQKRPKRLLSGLGRCGVCGNGWVVMGMERWGCAGYRDGKGCTNNRTLTNREYERRVLAGLDGQMLDPEAVALYLAEYRQRFEENAKGRGAERRRLQKQHDEAAARIARFVAAIGAGTGGSDGDIPELRDALHEARQARDEAKAALDALAAETNVVAMHPRAAERYKAEFADLQAALKARPEAMPAAAATIRSLVEAIIVWPAEQGRGTRIEIAGRMASILALATGQTAATCTLKVVPAVRHGQERTFLRARV